MNENNSVSLNLAFKIATEFSRLANVRAVALAGSQTSGAADPGSDIDLYVYSIAPIPLQQRVALAERSGYTRADLGLEFWDPGDEWFDSATGIEVDVIYWETAWIEDQLARVLTRHQASMGYSTCFWSTLRNSKALFDPEGWFQKLQTSVEVPYPEELRVNIIHHNHAVLRNVIPSYEHQIEKAQKRGDLVSINHRVAALLASYFDVLFALNRLPHPGEKRLVQIAAQKCAWVPEAMAENVNHILRDSASGDPRLMDEVNQLIDRLDELLAAHGFDPKTSKPIK